MQCVYRVIVYSAQKQNAYNPNKCDTLARLGRRGRVKLVVEGED